MAWIGKALHRHERRLPAWVPGSLLLLLVMTPLPAQALADKLIAWVRSQMATSTTHVVVIGIDEYDNVSGLDYAVNDARAMIRLFEALGHPVPTENRLLRDSRSDKPVRRSDIQGTVRRVLRQADAHDRVIIFYAGHGRQEAYRTGSREAFLAPSDYDPDKSVGTGLAFRDLVRMAAGSSVKARHVLFILDACYSGDALGARNRRNLPDEVTDPYIRHLVNSPGVVVLTAGDSGQPVIERDGHGVFTKYLIRGLAGEADRDVNGVVHFEELASWIRPIVFERSGAAQQKVTDGPVLDGGGEPVFVVPSRETRRALLGDLVASEIEAQHLKDCGARDCPYKPRTVPPPSQRPMVAVRADETCFRVWQAIENSNRMSDFQSFLTAYPDCPMAGIARGRLKTLRDRTGPAVAAPPAPHGITVVERDEILVALKNANVREVPNTNGTKLTTIPTGRPIAVTGRVAGRDWYRVALPNGGTGYVWAPLLGDGPSGVEVAVGTFGASSGSSGRKAGERFRDCPVCPEMVVVPAGRFTMGSPANEPKRDEDEGPQREVSIPLPFAVGKFEVTFEEWDACVSAGGCGGYRPDDYGWGRGRRPVIHVSWVDANAYVSWLSLETGQEYRLLSEAEWEYVARAGTTTPFHTGLRISPEQANFDGSYTYNDSAEGVYRAQTVPVGEFPGNAFGLHDMHGNVYEWVNDCYRDYYGVGPTDSDAWIKGSCARRVLRGGSWVSLAKDIRSVSRFNLIAGDRLRYVGFRVSRTLSQ